ncbi:MAG TPA: pyridoxamine 5'-phosphate oxidase family protein [Candidatus Acidoferrum sp.]|nr:pyridoxamine 5'-phosphate oxidase family protein [Candidatus Acidoferrum sp.]
MPEPAASRPYMPGYGLRGPSDGTGLLPWSWALKRLERSHDYWVATTSGPGQPHLMPVWAVWFEDALWFSSSRASRKARNIAAGSHCAIATDNPYEPVVIDGRAELIDVVDDITRFVAAVNQKYHTDYPVDFFTRHENACYRVRPRWAFGLMEADFTGSPTRWTFPP